MGLALRWIPGCCSPRGGQPSVPLLRSHARRLCVGCPCASAAGSTALPSVVSASSGIQPHLPFEFRNYVHYMREGGAQDAHIANRKQKLPKRSLDRNTKTDTYMCNDKRLGTSRSETHSLSHRASASQQGCGCAWEPGGRVGLSLARRPTTDAGPRSLHYACFSKCMMSLNSLPRMTHKKTPAQSQARKAQHRPALEND